MNRRSLLIGAAPALILSPSAASAAAAMALPRSADPQQRIEAAMNDIRAALAEMYPGFHVTSGVNLREGSGGLVLGAHPLKGYEVRHFFCDDPGGGRRCARERCAGNTWILREPSGRGDEAPSK